MPVRKATFDDGLAEREALIEFNRQREKTSGQLVNEFEEMLEIEEQRAKRRKGERTDLQNEADEETSGESYPEVRRAREEAADNIGTEM